MTFFGRIITGLALSACLFTTPAVAQDMDQGGATFSVWGGYFGSDAEKIKGFAKLPGGGGTSFEDLLDADEGWFGGASLAVPLRTMGPLPADRVELYFEGQESDEDTKSTHISNGFGALVLGVLSGGGVGNSSGIGLAELETERYEFGTRFHVNRQTTPINLFVTPFGGFGSQDQFADTINSVTGIRVLGNEADVDWWFLGAMLENEHRVPLGNRIALVFGAAGGAYYYDADGDFRTTAGAAGTLLQAVSDSESDVGFRGQISAQLEASVGPRAVLAVYGEVDYWSEVPNANMPSNLTFTGIPASVGSDSVTDYKGGVKLTLKLGNSN